MSTKLMPGAAARLHRLGLSRTAVGRYCNKATLIPPKDGVPIAKNSAELGEMFADADTFKQISADGRGGLAGWVDAYARQQQGEGTDLHQLVAIETQRQFAALLKEKDLDEDNHERIRRLNLDPQARAGRMSTSHGQAAAYNPKAAGARLDNLFEDAADFFAHAWASNPNPKVQAKMAQIRNDYSSVIPADGGHLVPEILRSRLLQLALELGNVRSRATVVPMDSARVPFPMIDVSSHETSVFGGMIAYWGEESAALQASNPRFGKVVLEANKLTGFAQVPNELLTDSIISFSALIESLWPRCLAFFEDIAFMKGTGVGQPLGFLGSTNPAAIAVDAEAGQAADTVELNNIIKMYTRMLPSSLNNAVWFCSPRVQQQLFTMALNVGTGGGPVMLTNAAGPAPMTILGRPLIPTEKASRLGDRGDISFVDLSYYLVGDRQQMSAETSNHYRFANDQTSYRIIQRVDGRPWLAQPLVPQNGDESLSPFVELAAR